MKFCGRAYCLNHKGKDNSKLEAIIPLYDDEKVNDFLTEQIDNQWSEVQVVYNKLEEIIKAAVGKFGKKKAVVQTDDELSTNTKAQIEKKGKNQGKSRGP